jgi:hypothetical protein
LRINLSLLWRPDIQSIRRAVSYRPWTARFTSDLAYNRLLGDRHAIEKKTKTWGAVIEDKGERLQNWAEVIRALTMISKLRFIYAFSNNHFAGYGPATARELMGRVQGLP